MFSLAFFFFLVTECWTVSLLIRQARLYPRSSTLYKFFSVTDVDGANVLLAG